MAVATKNGILFPAFRNSDIKQYIYMTLTRRIIRELAQKPHAALKAARGTILFWLRGITRSVE
jgi:hypothetical protein